MVKKDRATDRATITSDTGLSAGPATEQPEPEPEAKQPDPGADLDRAMNPNKTPYEGEADLVAPKHLHGTTLGRGEKIGKDGTVRVKGRERIEQLCGAHGFRVKR